jgi:release factor glutamine methyltransferase
MNSRVKRIFFKELVLDVFESVYNPAEDSFMSAENLLLERRDSVLDMGTGCGLLAILAARKARKVVATDVNPAAVRCVLHNASLNDVADKIDVRQGSLFEPIKADEEFDVILFNAPYLPSEAWEEHDMASRAWAGGESGRQVIDRFIDEALRHLKANGRILLVQSTLSDVEKSLQRFTEQRLDAVVIAERKVAFETIVVIKARRLNLSFAPFRLGRNWPTVF